MLRLKEQDRPQSAGAKLWPRPPISRKTPNDFGAEIPYYDEELDVGHGSAHEKAVWYLATLLRTIARRLGLVYHSDYPVRYIDHRTGKEKQFYPDFFLAKADTPERVTADDLLLAVEVVSTNDKRKARKDTETMRELNEYNGVPEFVLYFPKADDDRSVRWFRLEGETYVEIERDESGYYTSASVPTLRLRVLPRDLWEDGNKIDLYLGDECILNYEQEVERAEQAEREAEMAKREAALAKREVEIAKQEVEMAKQEAARERAARLSLEEKFGPKTD